MLNIYVAERLALMRTAALKRDLARQQHVRVALAHHQGSSTKPTGRYGRIMRWMHGHSRH